MESQEEKFKIGNHDLEVSIKFFLFGSFLKEYLAGIVIIAAINPELAEL